MVKLGVESTSSGFKYNSLENDALNALMALGIQKNVAENALKQVKNSTPEDNSLESLIKKSLQLI
jgi:Holliday junction DNA helicase RuvA